MNDGDIDAGLLKYISVLDDASDPAPAFSPCPTIDLEFCGKLIFFRCNCFAEIRLEEII